MGLFGKPKIEGKELQECLTYLDALGKVLALYSRESVLYGKAMIPYGNSITENPTLAAEDMKKATKRLSKAATDILGRHEEIRNIPVAASATNSAWHATFLANITWTSSLVTAIESNIYALLASAKGATPQIKHAQKVAIEYRKEWRRAEKKYKNFLKRLKISSEDFDKIVARATAMTDDD